MFKFGFNNEEANSNEEVETEEKNWYAAEEVMPIIENCNKILKSIKHFRSGNIRFNCVSVNDVINYLKQNTDTSNTVLKADDNHLDLITAEYEGGLKIWECTSDLINYLQEEKIDFKNRYVLDLGCGAGLLGLYALAKGASAVHFQDYNKEVLEYTTIPNVVLNSNHLNKCKFYSGDWKSFTDLVTDKYDYILTSETIYNTENYQKLHDLLLKLIEQNGTIFLAAKTYYFGVGGGLRQFEHLLEQNQKFTSNVCWKCTDGIQREILTIFKKY